MPKLLDYASLIQESCEELVYLEKTHQKSYLRDRIRFLRFLKEGRVKSQSDSGALIGLSARQSKNLWLKYKEEGISYFIQPRVNQNWGKLSSIQISRLLEHLDKDTTLTQGQVQKYIADNFGASLSQPGVHYLFKRLKVKLKTGRPSNIRKDEQASEVFKKNSP